MVEHLQFFGLVVEWVTMCGGLFSFFLGFFVGWRSRRVQLFFLDLLYG